MKKPVGVWHLIICEGCKVLYGHSRTKLETPFYCIPCFDAVAHLPEEGTESKADAGEG